MEKNLRARTRWLLWALPVWSLMLLLGTLTHQPDPQTRMADFAEYITTDWFLASHLINSILGAAIGSAGFIALMLSLSDTRAAGRSAVSALMMTAGNTITASVFGAAAFAQPAIGRLFRTDAGDALALYNDIYSVPLFLTAVIGLLLFIAGAVLAGAAISVSGVLPRWSGWLLAVSAAVYALIGIMFSPVQTPSAAGLLVATTTVAWIGTRTGERSPENAG